MENGIQDQARVPWGRNVFGLIGFILSLISITFFWYPFFGIINAIPGLVISSIGKNRAPIKPARIGFIISLIALILSIITTIWVLVLMANEPRQVITNTFY